MERAGEGTDGMDFDLIVIGSGPGGYHAAIRAAQEGLHVAVAERGAVGGVCLNVGCIPTKSLLHVAAEVRSASSAANFGVSFGTPEIDFQKVAEYKDGVVAQMSGGVAQLFTGNNITLLKGEARFTSTTSISVGDKQYSAKKFVVATGSRPVNIPGLEVDNEYIIDSTGALELKDGVPRRLLVVGGGAIGLEFADVYHSLGSEVTVVELADRIAIASDKNVSRELAKSFTQRGITVLTGTKVAKQEAKDGVLEVTLEGKETSTLTVDKILVAVGRAPNGKNLGLEEIGVTVDERGFVPVVNNHMQTNVSNIYAIGDVARGPLLAHKAMKEGLVAAEHAAGKPSEYDTIVPAVIYTSPEAASVGLTEQEAKDAGYELRIGRFPLAASGRAASIGEKDGFIKLIADEKTDLLLGCHIVGPQAGELISEAVLALEMGATLEDIALIQHPHPTLAEGIMEAAEHAHGRAIHIANRRRR